MPLDRAQEEQPRVRGLGLLPKTQRAHDPGLIVSQVANTLREAPNQGWDTASAINHLTSNFVITDEVRETRANYLKLKNTGNKTKTSNAAIQEAAYQVSLAKQAVLYEDAAKEQYVRYAGVLRSPKYNNGVVYVVPYTFPTIAIALLQSAFPASHRTSQSDR